MLSEATLPLLLVLPPNLHQDSEGALERGIRCALLRRAPVIGGTVAAPYAPGSGSALRRLLIEEGLEIVLTTASPRILRDLDLLVELDRRHSVTVRMVVPAWGARNPAPLLQAVRGLADEGIGVSVLLQAAPGGWGEEGLRLFLEEVREAQAQDVEIDAGRLPRGERARLLATFRRLRLEHGFPRVVAGRG